MSTGAGRRGLLPETRYATRGDVHVAYQVIGSGNRDLVLVSSWFSHVEALWEIPSFAHVVERLSGFSRVICFDKYGIGLSDPVPSRVLPTLEEWIDDVRAVMDAAGSEKATIMGANEGSLMAALFAAMQPDRTDALVLTNATARLAWAPDYPIGVPPEQQHALVTLLEETWGRGDGMAALNPTLADDPDALATWSRFLRLSASPATAALVMRMLFEIDVRDALPTIRVPTLVVHRRDAVVPPVEHGRYVAQHIEGAQLVELPGADYGLAVGDSDAVLDEVEEFLTGARASSAADRFLATVLVTDVVGSTEHAAQLGDRRWKELLETHDELVGAQIARYGGVLVDTAGDGVLATFDGPARAIRCALAVREVLRRVGLTIRAGLHTGEIERRGRGVAGLGVHIGARVAALAGPGEVLVSRTVKDLVVGAQIEFSERGRHRLKGVPDEWELFAAER